MSTANVKQDPIKDIKSTGKRAANKVAYSPAMENLVRLGYAVKGFIYVTMGYIALQAALGKGRTPADQLGAISEFSKLPYASILLWIILIGLIAYSLWGLVRAILDPLHKGTDTEGLLTRGGYLVSAATYATFVIPTYQLINGGRTGGSNQTAQLVGKLMEMPLGRFLVGAVGLAALGAGLYQVYLGIKMNFEKMFQPYNLSPEQFKLVKWIGRFGGNLGIIGIGCNIFASLVRGIDIPICANISDQAGLSLEQRQQRTLRNLNIARQAGGEQDCYQ